MEYSLRAVLILLAMDLSTAKQDPIVHIPTLGSVRGSQLSSASGRQFYAFRGIPYALPPVGELRFKDPVPANSWQGAELDVSKEGPMCIQYNTLIKMVRGQEDCLYLNVYTPKLNLTQSPLPVLVWIHGGAFYIGSGNGETDMFGPGYFLDRDIILVTLNYRLGPFGFASTEDAEAPGNYGLLDQSLALRWVRNHIEHFGGDSNSITIFGNSAGGASVEFHVLSPYSKGLFHRAIAQSGSAKCPWAVNTNIGEYTKMLAKHLNCSTSSSSDLLACLRTKDPVDIVEFRKDIALKTGFGIFPIGFTPRLDAERLLPFLPAHPDELISQKKFNHVPLIFGVVKNEGVLVTASFYVTGDQSMDEFNADPLRVLRYLINKETHPDGYKIAKLVHDQYLTDKIPYEDQITQLEKITSDYGLFKCVDESVKLFSKYSDKETYYYYYTHRGQLSYPQMAGVSDEIDLGVCHADENLMLFTAGFLPLLSVSDDIKVSETMIDLWTSYAQSGVPRSRHVETNWLPIKDGQVRYLEINANRPTLIEDQMPFVDRLPFWNDVMKNLSPPKKTEL